MKKRRDGTVDQLVANGMPLGMSAQILYRCIVRLNDLNAVTFTEF